MNDAKNNPDGVRQALHQELLALHGPVVGGVALARLLGYANLASFRQARRRGLVGVEVFLLPNRRGHFALTGDVSKWLATARNSALPAHTRKGVPV